MTEAARPTGYRPEVQGLRALAITLVIASHLVAGRVLAGVDVFFVLSGYVMTASLVRQLERGGVRPLHFLAQRFARLAPAVAVVLAACTAAILLWFGSGGVEQLGHVAASALFIENWHLIATGNEYGGLASDQVLAGHLWAFSVIAQLMVAWLVLALLAAGLARAARIGARGAFLLVVAAATAASFAYGLYVTAAAPERAYYDTGGRLWEFGAGGLVLLMTYGLSLRQGDDAAAGRRNTVALVGVAVLLVGPWLLPRDVAFPGWASLLPVIGTAAVLVAAAGGEAKRGTLRALATPLPAAVGAFAYTLYLWHWPVYVLYLHLSGAEHANPLAALGIVTLAVLLAAATYAWVEEPAAHAAKSKHPGRRRAAVATMVLGSALVVVGATAGAAALRGDPGTDRVAEAIGSGGATVEAEPEASASPGASPEATAPDWQPTATCVGAGALALDPDGDCVSTELGDLVLPEGDAAAALPDLETNGCTVGGSSGDLVECHVRDGDGPRVAIAGGSQAVQWAPALEQLADRYDWDLWSYSKHSCALNAELAGRGCDEWNDQTQQLLESLEPFDAIITAYRADSERTGRDGLPLTDQQIVGGFAESWAPLIAGGSSIVHIRSTPLTTTELLDCVGLSGLEAHAGCILTRAEAEPADPVVQLAERTPGAYVIDLNDYICSATECSGLYGNVKVYRDETHLTPPYVVSLAPYLEAALREQMPGLFPSEQAGAGA